MPDWSLVDRAHVLAALQEADRVGSRDFLSRYRFARAKASTLWHGGQEYDPNAIMGVAYLHATGRAVTRADLAGAEARTARVLKGLGFDVVIDEDAMIEQDRLLDGQPDEPAPAAPTAKAPAAKRTTATKKAAKTPARPKPVEREVKICPTCYTALPATGVCDFCD
jgi:hypothetical protein